MDFLFAFTAVIVGIIILKLISTEDDLDGGV